MADQNADSNTQLSPDISGAKVLDRIRELKNGTLQKAAVGTMWGLLMWVLDGGTSSLARNVLNGSAKDLMNDTLRKLQGAPRITDGLDHAITELEHLSSEGRHLRDDLPTSSDSASLYQEIVEGVLRKLEDNYELKRSRHIAGIMARAAMSKAEWGAVHTMLRIAPEITYDEMCILQVFAELGENSKWRENMFRRKVAKVHPFVGVQVERLRRHQFINPPRTFEQPLKITDLGISAAWLLALDRIPDRDLTIYRSILNYESVLFQHGNDRFRFFFDRFQHRSRKQDYLLSGRMKSVSEVKDLKASLVFRGDEIFFQFSSETNLGRVSADKELKFTIVVPEKVFEKQEVQGIRVRTGDNEVSIPLTGFLNSIFTPY